MNAHSVLDEVDEYVEALLGDTMEAPALAARTDAATQAANEPVAVEVAMALTDPAHPPMAEVPAPAAPVAEEARAPAQVHAPATPQSIPAAAFQPLPSPPPVRATQAPVCNRWLRVAVGSDSYAIELLCVQEVVRVTPIVAMRGANPAVLGVMNLRGRIVPVFDLGLWLGTRCVQPEERSRIVVVERDDELIGVLVTLVEDVVTLTQDRIEPPLPGSTRGSIVGVARAGTGPTVLLDAGALFRG